MTTAVELLTRLLCRTSGALDGLTQGEHEKALAFLQHAHSVETDRSAPKDDAWGSLVYFQGEVEGMDDDAIRCDLPFYKRDNARQESRIEDLKVKVERLTSAINSCRKQSTKRQEALVKLGKKKVTVAEALRCIVNHGFTVNITDGGI